MHNMLYFILGFILCMVNLTPVMVVMYLRMKKLDDFMMAQKDNAAFSQIQAQKAAPLKEKSKKEQENEQWNLYVNGQMKGEIDDDYIKMFGEKDAIKQ